MIRVVALFACCLFVSSTALGGKPDDAAAADLKAMVGNWKLTKAELGGKDALALLKDLKFEITGPGKYTAQVGEQKDNGTFTVDPSKKPAEMDIKATGGPNKDRTIKAIYKLDGDAMTICYELGGDARPAKFESKPDTKLFLAAYKRETK
jgi:uncharacterized protein (TIGR03067 family)